MPYLPTRIPRPALWKPHRSTTPESPNAMAPQPKEGEVQEIQKEYREGD